MFRGCFIFVVESRVRCTNPKGLHRVAQGRLAGAAGDERPHPAGGGTGPSVLHNENCCDYSCKLATELVNGSHSFGSHVRRAMDQKKPDATKCDRRAGLERFATGEFVFPDAILRPVVLLTPVSPTFSPECPLSPPAPYL